VFEQCDKRHSQLLQRQRLGRQEVVSFHEGRTEQGGDGRRGLENGSGGALVVERDMPLLDLDIPKETILAIEAASHHEREWSSMRKKKKVQFQKK
jgi:hypothetical protein